MPTCPKCGHRAKGKGTPPGVPLPVDLATALFDQCARVGRQTVAHALGVTPGRISLWISGDGKISAQNLAKLTAYLEANR